MMHMKKQIYTSPLVEISWCNTQMLMDVAPESDKPKEPAPKRRESAF